MELLEELGGHRGQLKIFVLKNNRHFMSWHNFSFYADHNLHALLSLFLLGCEGRALFQLGGEGPSLLLPALGEEE